jgi:hypothetical protein
MTRVIKGCVILSFMSCKIIRVGGMGYVDKITWNVADPCFLICGLDCFYTGNAKNYGSCPLDKILSSGYLAIPCLCFWTTNFIQWLAVHWISSRPVDNLIQWITLSSILNNRALVTVNGLIGFWLICTVKIWQVTFCNFRTFS